jgi:hypothetical protein
VKAQLQYYRKVTVLHTRSLETGVCELKVWRVTESPHYPDGIKFSLFLVSRATGAVIIGIDNHKPKGPHLHEGARESEYEFTGVDRLVDDFWDRVKKEGYEL